MSGESVAILGSILGAIVTMIVILTLRISEMRERLGKLEEWVRLTERRGDGEE
jgi:uncharacterized integral membrane protein